MPSLPRWLSFGVLPFFAFLDYFAWYATRAILPIYLGDGGSFTLEDLSVLRSVMTGSLILGTVLAAIVALATGPWVPLAAGAAIMAFGIACYAVAPPDLAVILVVFVALGHGMVRPAVYGAAARAFSGSKDEHIRNALFLLLGTMPSIGGFLGPLVSSEVAAAGSAYESAFFTAASAALVGTVVAVALGLVVFSSRDVERQKPKLRPVHLGVVVALLFAVALPWSSYGAVWTELYTTFGDHPSIELSTLTSINPIAITVLTPVGVAVAAILHFMKVKLPTLIGVGVGLLFVGLGSTLIMHADPESDVLHLVWAGIVLVSLGELIGTPLLLSRASAALPNNLETLVVAGYLILLRIPGMLGFHGGTLMWVGAVAAGIIGVGLIAAAYPLQRVFAPPGGTGPAEF